MAIVRGLCTLAEARLSIFGEQEAAASITRNTLIEDYISAATVVIEGLPGVGPQFAESRTVTFNGGGSLLVMPYNFNTVTSITVDGVAFTSYTSDVAAGIIYGGTSATPVSFNSGTQNVVVVVTVGSATVSPEVKMAARELVTHWWRNGQQGTTRPSFGATDSGPDPAVAFGVPTRRLMELLGGTGGVAGFA